MIWLVNVTGIFLLVFIIWWFWLSLPKRVLPVGSVVDIQVLDGVYTPARIEIAKDQDVVLRFHRLDPDACAEIVRFDDLGIRLELPLNAIRDVHICIETPGEYSFSCDMNMYQGSLIVT
ncbi:MAG: cupredoxin domain-containing protein [Gammaproteobacteria bacterium]|nr:cupredoxin domain-containing protein [Gammaproteobacteria bacterium]MDH5735319.1 cupredoxin domain-containing protein [Gammaproteobacteria bacterium]